MINVSEVITDPDFAQPYMVYRQFGEWERGHWKSADEKRIRVTGVVTVADAKTLEQLPEGDRITGLMCFYATQELFETREEGISDQIEWRGERYKVKRVFPYGDYGYYKAVGERMTGA